MSQNIIVLFSLERSKSEILKTDDLTITSSSAFGRPAILNNNSNNLLTVCSVQVTESSHVFSSIGSSCTSIFTINVSETCTVDYVLFETATTLKDALVREWKYLPEAEVSELRQFLLEYVIQKPTLRPYVRERILQQMLGCSIISAVIQEYSNTVKSSDIGLVWEDHFQLKKDFEDHRHLSALQVQADDHLFMEAFENLMKVWLTLLSDSSHFSDDFCNQASVEVFNTYIKCHLSPPDGTRGTGRELDAEEIEENDEIDQVKFKLQLIAVGVLGRRVSSDFRPFRIDSFTMEL
ncbi:unnamed protein product [Nesidiocoris tenuis]|uniref:Exportin-4 n=1 Tax=Nesidiocoris tenuis TaxID=355587 RepID=A0A6H5H223_9HEMI|nr:unnamed protein product [Nesidiocoris tenuis]